MSYAFIFIGRSGCGKGTQAKLLIEYLTKEQPDRKIYYLETGARFREFVKGADYSNQLAKTIMARGDRQPDFLAVWMWSHLLIENLKGGEDLVFDGTPRSLPEAQALETALKFYGCDRRVAIFLNTSRDWAIRRLGERGRADDQSLAEVNRRLDWFETAVKPAIDFYRGHPHYHFVEVNGEQPIEKVHADLTVAINHS